MDGLLLSCGIFILLPFFVAELGNCQPAVTLKAGIVLTIGTNNPYDYNIVKPALRAAYDEALQRFNVQFEEVLCLYDGDPSGSGCSATGAVGKTYECGYLKKVDMIIGKSLWDGCSRFSFLRGLRVLVGGTARTIAFAVYLVTPRS